MEVNSKLTTFEVFCLMNILIAMIITNTTPSIIAQNTKNAFWYIPLLSFIIVLPSLLILIYLINKYDADHLVHLLEILFGKFLGKAVAFSLFFLYFFASAFDIRSYVGQVKLLYFEQAGLFNIFVILMLVCIFGAIRGIKVIGYTAKFFLPYFFTSIIILIILIYPSLIPRRIFPIFGTGLSYVIEEAFFKGSLFSKFILFLMIKPAVKNSKHLIKGSLIGLIVSVIQMMIFFFIYTTFFDYDSISTTPFPFHEMVQYVKIGEFFTNIETFFLVFWLLAMFIRFTLVLYLLSWMFGAIFNIKNFELLILPLGFLLMVIGLIPDNTVVTEVIFRNSLFNIASPIVLILPIILLFCHFIRVRIRRS